MSAITSVLITGANVGLGRESARQLALRDEVEKIYVSQLGTGARSAIHAALNRGASLVSYLGHGALSMWASENIFDRTDIPQLLLAQRLVRQPPHDVVRPGGSMLQRACDAHERYDRRGEQAKRRRVPAAT